MKKLILFLLSLMLFIFLFTSCRDDNEENEQDQANETTNPQTPPDDNSVSDPITSGVQIPWIQ